MICILNYFFILAITTIYTHVLKSRNLINAFHLHKAQNDTAPALIPQKTIHADLAKHRVTGQQRNLDSPETDGITEVVNFQPKNDRCPRSTRRNSKKSRLFRPRQQYLLIEPSVSCNLLNLRVLHGYNN